MWLKNDVAKVQGFSETCNTKNLGFLQKKIPNVCETLGIFSLSKADSNHHKQNQNLLCYHYTIGHRLLNAGAKVRNIWHTTKLFQTFLFYYQKIIVLLSLLCQQVLTVNQVFGCNWAILVGKLLLVQRYATSLHHLTHLTL